MKELIAQGPQGVEPLRALMASRPGEDWAGVMMGSR